MVEYDGLIWLFGKDESPFIDNINDAYDHFNERLRTAEHDFIEIGIEMDWQKLVNKAAEVETKAKVRGSRTSAYKASKRKAATAKAEANKNAKGDKPKDKSPRSTTSANFGFVTDIEEIQLMVADTTRYPEVEIEEKKIKRCLADARRSKGHNYYLDFGVARH
ncbi:MAG: hypothetical protein L6R36_009471, partial [Xanthoria steineri]